MNLITDQNFNIYIDIYIHEIPWPQDIRSLLGVPQWPGHHDKCAPDPICPMIMPWNVPEHSTNFPGGSDRKTPNTIDGSIP